MRRSRARGGEASLTSGARGGSLGTRTVRAVEDTRRGGRASAGIEIRYGLRRMACEHDGSGGLAAREARVSIAPVGGWRSRLAAEQRVAPEPAQLHSVADSSLIARAR